MKKIILIPHLSKILQYLLRIAGFLIFTFYIFYGNSALSQSPLVKNWDYRFGGFDDDNFSIMIQTNDGGYILGGRSLSGIGGDKTQPSWGDFDYWIVKTDSMGTKQWDKRFGGTNSDYLYWLQQTVDGGYILGGYSASDSSGDKTEPSWTSIDYWILKIDSLGSKQWDKRFGGTEYDPLFSIEQTTDGGYILGGYSYSDISGDKTEPNWDPTLLSPDYWMVKIDSTGIKQWDRRYGGNEWESLLSIHQTTDGGYILGGYSLSGISGDKTEPSWGGYDHWIVKTDWQGNKEWDKRFGGTDNDYLQSLKQTTDGGYIFGGKSLSGTSGDKTQPSWGGYDFWIVKTDWQGNKEWDKRFGGTANEDDFGNIFQTSDGGYLITCTSYSQASGDKTENNLGMEQIWMVKTDSLGIKQWDKTVFTIGHDESGFAIQTGAGCYTAANYTNAGIGGYKTQAPWNNSSDYWIIKFCDSTFTGINESADYDLELRVMPNPANDFITLSFTLPEQKNFLVRLFNIYGQMIESKNDAAIMPGKQQIKIDINTLPQGIYFATLDADKKHQMRKVVKY